MNALSRTYRVTTVLMVTVFSTASSANVPVATGALQVAPLSLIWILYCPIRPSGRAAGGGR